MAKKPFLQKLALACTLTLAWGVDVLLASQTAILQPGDSFAMPGGSTIYNDPASNQVMSITIDDQGGILLVSTPVGAPPGAPATPTSGGNLRYWLDSVTDSSYNPTNSGGVITIGSGGVVLSQGGSTVTVPSQASQAQTARTALQTALGGSITPAMEQSQGTFLDFITQLSTTSPAFSGQILNDVVSIANPEALADFYSDLAPSSASSMGAVAGAQASSGSASGAVGTRLAMMRGDTVPGSPLLGMAAGDAAEESAWWMQPFYSHMSQGRRDGVDGFELDNQGLVFGVDHGFSSSTRLGLAAVYSQSDVDGRGTGAGSGSDITSAQASLYGSHSWGDISLDAEASLGMQWIDATRLVTALSERYDARYNGLQTGASATLTRRFVRDGTVIRPYVSARYNGLRLEDYQESGNGLLGFAVSSEATHSLTVGGGVSLSHRFDCDIGRLTPGIKLGYDYSFGDDQMVTTAAYSTGNSFVSSSAEIARGAWLSSIGVDYEMNDQLTLGLQTSYTKREQAHTSGVSAKLRVAF